MNQSYKLIACTIFGAGYITVTGMAAIAQDEFADPVAPPVAPENTIPQETKLQLRERVADLEDEEKALNARIDNIRDNQGEIKTNAEQVNEIANVYEEQSNAVDEAFVICDALAVGLVRQKKLAELTAKGIIRTKEFIKECYDRADKSQQELILTINHRSMLIKEGKFLKEQASLNVDESTYLQALLKVTRANLKAARIRLRHLGGE